MKPILLLPILFALLLIPCVAQKEEKQENIVCSELKTASLSVANDEILIAGKVIAPQVRKIKEQVFTLSQYIALVGGIIRGNKNIVVFNCSSNTGKAENVVFTDYDKIRKGKEPDFEMKGGEIIFVLSESNKKVPSVLPAFEPRCCGICSKLPLP